MNCLRCNLWTWAPSTSSGVCSMCDGSNVRAEDRLKVHGVHPSHLPTIVDLLEDEVAALRPCRDFALWVANCAHAEDCDCDPCTCLVGRAREVAEKAGLLDHDGYAASKTSSGDT